MGRTPEEAFFVKCDEETNPPESIDAGQVVTLIGIAPVKPAEFIVFRIGQHQPARRGDRGRRVTMADAKPAEAAAPQGGAARSRASAWTTLPRLQLQAGHRRA